MKAKSTSSMLKILALLLAIVMCFSACDSGEDVSSNQDAANSSVNQDATQEVESSADESEQAATNDDSSEDQAATDDSSSEDQAATNDSSSEDQAATNNVESQKDNAATSTSKTSTTQNNNQNNNQNNTQSNKQNNTQSNNQSNTQSNNQNNTQSNNQNNNQSTVSKEEQVVNTKTTWDDNYISTMPDSVKKKGITILFWRYLLPTEKKLIADFEKKTGCKVTVIETTETEYSTKLISLIAGKASPDVVALDHESFPARAVKAMIPLDKTMFRLDDDCWDKASMENVKINNYYYGVSQPRTWSCSDVHYVTFYQPSVLKQCGVQTMPYDLWKQGKWNWDAQQQIAQTIAAANRGYAAVSMQSNDIMMLAAGADFVSYNGKQYTNTLKSASGSSALVRAWQATVKLYEAGNLTGWDLKQVKNGKTGLFTTISYGLYNEADWDFKSLPGGANSVNAVPVAAENQSQAYVPYRPKNWGVAKGSKNPEGAAYFLRYYLDSENCDFDNTFLNSQCKEVFDYIVAKGTKRKAKLGAGAIDFVGANNYANLLSRLTTSTSANITTTINSNVGTVDAAVKRINKELEKAAK